MTLTMTGVTEIQETLKYLLRDTETFTVQKISENERGGAETLH